MRVKEIERQICDVEGIEIRFHHRDGRDVRDDMAGLPPYPFDNAGWGKWSLSELIEKRLANQYPKFDFIAYYPDNTKVHGNTKLKSIRGVCRM